MRPACGPRDGRLAGSCRLCGGRVVRIGRLAGPMPAVRRACRPHLVGSPGRIVCPVGVSSCVGRLAELQALTGSTSTPVLRHPLSHVARSSCAVCSPFRLLPPASTAPWVDRCLCVSTAPACVASSRACRPLPGVSSGSWSTRRRTWPLGSVCRPALLSSAPKRRGRQCPGSGELPMAGESSNTGRVVEHRASRQTPGESSDSALRRALGRVVHPASHRPNESSIQRVVHPVSHRAGVSSARTSPVVEEASSEPRTMRAIASVVVCRPLTSRLATLVTTQTRACRPRDEPTNPKPAPLNRTESYRPSTPAGTQPETPTPARTQPAPEPH